jgi:hypothetical protein
MLTRTVSANKIAMNIVRRIIDAMRRLGETPETGSFACGLSDVAISLTPPGRHDRKQWLSSASAAPVDRLANCEAAKEARFPLPRYD